MEAKELTNAQEIMSGDARRGGISYETARLKEQLIEKLLKQNAWLHNELGLELERNTTFLKESTYAVCRAFLLGLVAGAIIGAALVPQAHAEDKMTYAEAVEFARSDPGRCIMNEEETLIRSLMISTEPMTVQTTRAWEQCTTQAGWVSGSIVESRMQSDKFKASKWQRASCRCQHE